MIKEVPCELTGQPRAVINAMTGRAEYLYHIVKAMDEAGVEGVDEILQKAINNVGRTWNEKLGDCENPSVLWNKLIGNDDMKQILKLDWIKDEPDEVVLHFYRCPLVFGWRQLGLEPDMIKRLCNIANQVDYGNMQASGFNLDMDPGLANGKDKCVLKITK